MAQRQRQRDQDVEQHGYFELVAEAIADLGGAGRLVRLPSAMSLRLVSRAFTALVRAVAIHSSRKKVSPTRTKTGSKTI